MISEARAKALIDGLERIKPEFFLYLPDSAMASTFEHFIDSESVIDLPLTKEEEGVGILSGLALSGRRGLMAIQDTGLGNSITALTTFAAAYHVPIFIVASRTGGVGEINSAVHRYSDHLLDVLRAARIFFDVLDWRTPHEQWAAHILSLFRYAQTSHQPVIALVDLKGGQPNALED